MLNYKIQYPREIIFANDSLLQLPKLIPKRSKIIMITGKSVVASGVASQLKELLKNNDFDLIDATGMTQPEPPLENIDTIVALGRKESATAVVAVGGGSTIDVAKVAAAIIPLEGKSEDYFTTKREIPKKGLFFVAVPTTAGTGAEITNNSVITDSKNRVKKSIRSVYMTADVAIIDPKLTLTMPPAITASSGLDALTQAIESFTSLSANSITQSLAKEAIKKILNSLLLAYKNGTVLEHREAVAEGSLLSAMAFSQSGLGAVHGLAHPIGSILKIPHGLTCAILLPSIIKFNSKVSSNDYNEILKFCGIDATYSLFQIITNLCNDMNVPTNFIKLGLLKSHYPFIIKNCRSNSMNSNPRIMENSDIIKILDSLIIK